MRPAVISRAIGGAALVASGLLAAHGTGGACDVEVPSGTAVVEVDGVRVGLSAQVWIDRTPRRPAGTRSPAPLRLAVQLAAAGSGVPEGIGADRFWVRVDDRVWERRFDHLMRDGARLTGGAGGGPEVSEDAPAVVVVRLTAPDGVRYLRARVPRVRAVY